MKLSSNLKEMLGMVEENVGELKKELTWTPLPTKDELITEVEKKSGTAIDKDFIASSALDLTPAGAVTGMIKRVKPEWGLKGFTDDMIRGFHNKLGDVYDEAFSPNEAFEAALKQASKKEAAVLRALQKDDFLGFDYPHQALRAILENPENFDISPVLKGQLTKLGSTLGVVGGVSVAATASNEAEAGNVRDMLGVESHSGISTQSATAIKQLEQDLAPPQEKPVVHTPEKGRTQQQVFKEIFGVRASERKKKGQEQQLQDLLKSR